MQTHPSAIQGGDSCPQATPPLSPPRPSLSLVSGFQRLMTEVSLNHVGLVLGLELSRLSRSNKDWHQLIDVCGIFNTLLGDQDAVYW